MVPEGLAFYARICGWTLARAHARSGDPAAIAAYLGASDKFDESITGFSARYADSARSCAWPRRWRGRRRRERSVSP
jgi:hypothetical protein